MGSTLATAPVALVLAVLHLEAGRTFRLPAPWHRRALSLAAGVSVAYIFVHLLPELKEHQAHLAGYDHPILRFFEVEVYLLALVGFTLFFGLDQWACRHCQDRPEDGGDHAFFWIHIGSFALYNTVIGYLLVNREAVGWLGLVLFAVAFGLHFFIIDHGLRAHHAQIYHRFGRWVLAAAILLGWAIGSAWHLDPAALAVLVALLGGSAILNVMKEELPSRRDSCWWAFALGAAVYAAILIATLQSAKPD